MDSQKKREIIQMIENAKAGDYIDVYPPIDEKQFELSRFLLHRKGNMSNELLAALVGCNLAYVYSIMKGTKHPDKDMLLRIAFVLGMSLDDTQEMLHIARRRALSLNDERDSCIIFGLVNGLGSETIDDVLVEKGVKPLFSDYKLDGKLYEIISVYLKERSIKGCQLISYIKCSTELYNSIINKLQMGPRDLLLRIAFVLKMKLLEVQVMLKLEKKPVLSVKDARDMFIMNGLANGMSPDEIEKMLKEQGQKPLWEKFYDLPLSAEDG